MSAPTQTLAPYAALAAVYDRWTADNDYQRWVDFVTERLRVAGTPVSSVLDLCCGTGTVTSLLQGHGFTVSGVDGSADMLARAAPRVAAGTPLHQVLLPGPLPFPRDTFDAAVCCFDSVNYFAPEQLPALFEVVAAVLRSGGLFVFDVNTRHKLEHLFGNSHYGNDLGDYAYVWRNRYQVDEHRCDYAITLFTESGTGFTRHVENHRQWWFEPDQIRAAAQAAGFTVRPATDDYTDRPTGPDTLRETWILVRRNESIPAAEEKW
jgi:SAM-dependent methyltransferase